MINVTHLNKSEKDVLEEAQSFLRQGLTTVDADEAILASETPPERAFYAAVIEKMQELIFIENNADAPPGEYGRSRSARKLVEEFKDGGELEAAQRADRAIEHGDPQGEGYWRDVIRQASVLNNRSRHSPFGGSRRNSTRQAARSSDIGKPQRREISAAMASDETGWVGLFRALRMPRTTLHSRPQSSRIRCRGATW